MPIRSARCVLAVAMAFCLPLVPGPSRAAAGELPPPSASDLARALEEARTAARIPGLAWAVVRDDAVVSQGGSVLENLEVLAPQVVRGRSVPVRHDDVDLDELGGGRERRHRRRPGAARVLGPERKDNCAEAEEQGESGPARRGHLPQLL